MDGERPQLRIACTREAAPAVEQTLRRLNRREALLAAGVAMFAAACHNGSSSGPTLSAPASGARLLEPHLWLTVPAGTLNRATARPFERRNQVRVDRRVFHDQDALETNLAKAPSSFDVVVARQDVLWVLAQRGLLYQLDHALLPNARQVAAPFLDRDFDPGNRYTLPREYGAAGFGYRRDKVREQPRTWADFFRLLPRYERRGVGLIEGAVENVYLAIASFGGDINSDDDAVLAHARHVLAGALRAASSVGGGYVRRFLRGHLVLAQGWNGDFARIVTDPSRAEDTAFVLPEGKSAFWMDSWAISAGTAHPFAAHAWIDYALSPAAVALQWTGPGRSFPVPAALRIVPDSISGNPYTNADPTRIAGYQTFLPTPVGLQKRFEVYAAAASH